MTVFQDRKIDIYVDRFINKNISVPRCEYYFYSALGADFSLTLKRYYNRKSIKFFRSTNDKSVQQDNVDFGYSSSYVYSAIKYSNKL